MEEQIGKLLEQYWDEYGYTRQSTMDFIDSFKSAMSDHAIVVDIDYVSHEVDYDEEQE
jgi:hypothetical protein